jgi:uncharacterized protein (TIGR00251 family)
LIALNAHRDGTILPVRAQPGARRDAIVGVHADSLRVAVTAPADKGRANAAIRALLARTLGCSPSQIGLLSGETSRQKRFLIAGLPPDELAKRIASVLERDRRE